MIQLQELIILNITRTCSVSFSLLSSPNANLKLDNILPRLQPYVSTLTSMTILQFHTHTPPSHSQTSRLLLVVRLFITTQKQVSDPPLCPLRITKETDSSPISVIYRLITVDKSVDYEKKNQSHE